MPRITIKDSTGLVQASGDGIDIRSKGMTGAITRTVSVAGVANHNLVFPMPPGALITDVAFLAPVVIRAGNTAGADELRLTLGTSVGGTELIGNTAILTRNDVTVAGASQSVISGNKVHAGGASMDFANGAKLSHTAAREVHGRLAVLVNAMVTGGPVKVTVHYTVL